MFQAVIDGGQGIFDRKDETGGELLQASPGIHQCGRIVKKIEASHAIVPALGRVGQPEDAARLIAFLASEAGGWITGQIIHSRGA